jgi:hypothetical protein
MARRECIVVVALLVKITCASGVTDHQYSYSSDDANSGSSDASRFAKSTKPPRVSDVCDGRTDTQWSCYHTHSHAQQIFDKLRDVYGDMVHLYDIGKSVQGKHACAHTYTLVCIQAPRFK